MEPEADLSASGGVTYTSTVSTSQPTLESSGQAFSLGWSLLACKRAETIGYRGHITFLFSCEYTLDGSHYASVDQGGLR